MRSGKLNRGFTLVEMVILFAVLGAVGAASSGYYYAAKVRQNKRAAATPAPVVHKARTVTVQLEEQGGSGRRGMAVLTEIRGKVKVVMNLSGPSGGILRPAHIHTGSCTDIGGVKYPLSSLDEGASQTDLDMSLDQLLTQLPLAINIHKSPEEPSIYLACGDIKADRDFLIKQIDAQGFGDKIKEKLKESGVIQDQ